MPSASTPGQSPPPYAAPCHRAGRRAARHATVRCALSQRRREIGAGKGHPLREPRDDPNPDTGQPETRAPKWSRTVEIWIVFGVTALSVLALAYLVLGAARDHAVALVGALAVAGVAGAAAARTPKVRAGVIGVLNFLQNLSQLWR